MPHIFGAIALALLTSRSTASSLNTCGAVIGEGDYGAVEAHNSLLQLSYSLGKKSNGSSLMSENLTIPWDHYTYVVGTRHKAGTFLLDGIMGRTFETLMSNRNLTQTSACSCSHYGSCADFREPTCTAPSWASMPSSTLDNCPNGCDNCPFQFFLEMHAEHLTDKRQQGMRAVQMVRDPFDMVASAYCYHHAGQEFSLCMAPGVMSMGAEEGVTAQATRMIHIVRDMVEAYQASESQDTYVVFYENITRSSADFDSTVASMFDFLFEDMLSPEERRQIEIGAQAEDQNRGIEEHHSSDDECKIAARSALSLIPEPLYSEYQHFRAVLGYS